ncbi:MAG: hydrolase 1, exosortase A system-associated [Steroidobacteraceae bacterium]
MNDGMGAVEPLVFQCQGSKLVGILHRAAGVECEVAVLIVVGGPQYRAGSHRQFVLSARALADAGFPVLRFDYRGMGDSEGDLLGFEHVTEDIRAAVDTIEVACHPRRGVVLLGLCDAASAVLMYCASDARVAGLVLMNPWVRSEQSQAAVVVRKYYLSRLLQAGFWRKLAGGGFDFRGSAASLLGSLARASKQAAPSQREGFIGAMRAGLRQFAGPVLIVQSGRDLTADEFRARCRADSGWRQVIARSGVEIVDMPEADHTFSQASQLAEFNERCRRWLAQRFGGAPCR